MNRKINIIIKEYCKDHGISLLELSCKSNIDYSLLNNLANNKKKQISFSVLERIMVSTGCQITDIMQLQ